MVIPLRLWSQCPTTATIPDSYPDWPIVSVSDFVFMDLNQPGWALWDGSESPINEAPLLTDMGVIDQLTEVTFTVRHRCNVSAVEAISSQGTLVLDSIIPVDAVTLQSTWRFTAPDPGTAQVEIDLVDDQQQVFFQGILNYTVMALPTRTLSVSLGSGVLGSPDMTADHIINTVVDYDYSLDTCYEGLSVTLDAVPVSAMGQVTMDDNHALVVTALLRTQTVTVTSSAGGMTDRDGMNLIDCGDDLTITATADSGFFFAGWTGDASGSGNPLDLTDVQQDLNIGANFSPISTIDLAFNRVELIQGITMSPTYRVHIANRDSVLRVFTQVTGASSIAGVQARLTRYVGGLPQDQIFADNGPRTLPAMPNEGSLNDTLYFSLPSHWLGAGTAYVLELDPLNAVIEFNETNNRYPAAGSQSFDFQTVSPVEFVIIPVRYQRSGSGPISEPDTSNLSYLTHLPIKVYPTHDINYSLHAPMNFTGDLRSGTGWNALLTQVMAIRNMEDPGRTKLYYGLVDFFTIDGCPGSCIAGLGQVGDTAACGFSGWGAGTPEASETFTHEAGHNFNRHHAPCGVSDPDPSYPYGSAQIGQWGLDLSSLTLKSPGTKDYMSYCNPVWTSDYTYKRIYDWRETHSYKSLADLQDALVVSGTIADGEWTVGPVVRTQAVLRQTESAYRVRLLDASASLLFEGRVLVHEIADGDRPAYSFQAAVPDMVDALRLQIVADQHVIWQCDGQQPVSLDEINIADGNHLSWRGSPAAHYVVKVSGDGGRSWQVLDPGTTLEALELPLTWLRQAPQPVVEVEAIRGLNRATKRLVL